MRWPATDRMLVIAENRVSRLTGQNGEWRPDAESPRADPNYYEPDAIRFQARGPFTNWAEKARLDAIDAWKKTAGDDPNMNGMFWNVDPMA